MGAQAGEIGVDLGSGDRQCEYRNWGTVAGPGAWVVAVVMGGQWDGANRRCGEGLKWCGGRQD